MDLICSGLWSKPQSSCVRALRPWSFAFAGVFGAFFWSSNYRRYHRLIGTHTESRGFPSTCLLHEEVSSSSFGLNGIASPPFHTLLISHCERRRLSVFFIISCHFLIDHILWKKARQIILYIVLLVGWSITRLAKRAASLLMLFLSVCCLVSFWSLRNLGIGYH